MKKLLKMFAVFAMVNLMALSLPKQSSAQVAVSFQVFYDELSPYGNWVDYPSYGYVWVPTAETGFTPYGTGGHWEWTDQGWLWVSDYAWGWAPFHYGRWFFDNSYGWVWLPGRTWGPAWVTWRSAPGYYGWTPLGPGIGINGYASYNPPADRWIFCENRYINSPRVHDYYAARTNNVTIINKSTVINNTYVDNSRHTTYVAGPRKDEVQKFTGADIKPTVIKENSKPGQTVGAGEVNLYRPVVQKTPATAQKPAPQKVEPMKKVAPVSGSNVNDAQSKPNKIITNPKTIAPKTIESQKVSPTVNAPKQQKIVQPQKVSPTVNAPKQQKIVQPQKQVAPKTAPIEKQTAPKVMSPNMNKPQHQVEPKMQQAPQQKMEQPKQQAQPKMQTAPMQHEKMNPPHEMQQAPMQKKDVPKTFANYSFQRRK